MLLYVFYYIMYLPDYFIIQENNTAHSKTLLWKTPWIIQKQMHHSSNTSAKLQMPFMKSCFEVYKNYVQRFTTFDSPQYLIFDIALQVIRFRFI